MKQFHVKHEFLWCSLVLLRVNPKVNTDSLTVTLIKIANFCVSWTHLRLEKCTISRNRLNVVIRHILNYAMASQSPVRRVDISYQHSDE